MRHFQASLKRICNLVIFSDYRSSNIGPSDSEKEFSLSRRDSESTGPNTTLPTSRLAVGGNDSESGGSHSPSPRASRRRQVSIYRNSNHCSYLK